MPPTDLKSDRQVVLGIIGLGYTGRQQLLASASVPQIRVTAVAETRPEPVRSAAAEIEVYRDWGDLLLDPVIQAVSICLPHHLHAEAVIESLKAGKHVLVEKPLAIDCGEAKRIVAAADRAHRQVMVEMTHRFYPPVQEGKDLVGSGRLGRIYAAEDRIIEPVNPDRFPAWLLQRRMAGGGVALTSGIHMLDRTAWVCGQGLRFLFGSGHRTHRLGDVEDTAAMQLCLEDGTPVSLLASWPRADGPMDDELTVYGTEGTLRIWAWRGWRFEPVNGEPEEHLCYDPDADHFARVRVGMAGALREFAQALLGGRSPNPTAREVLPAQSIIDQFYQRSA